MGVMPLPGEEWRGVKGVERLYLVSSVGRVCSLRQKTRLGGGLMRCTPNDAGYPTVSIATVLGGKSRPQRVHRLMLLAFVGPPPRGAFACHTNGIRSDNRLENLRWGSQVENMADARRHGTFAVGAVCKNAKLSESDVIAIRASTENNRVLSEIYGVHRSHISSVRNGRWWKHIAAERTR